MSVSAGLTLLAMKVMPGDFGIAEEIMSASVSGNPDDVDLFDDLGLDEIDPDGFDVEEFDLEELYPETEPTDPENHKFEDRRYD